MLALPLPCRRCHHDDDQHDPEDPLNPDVPCPCHVEGCGCDAYEADD